MARVVEDLAHMLNAIAGHDPKDPTSSSAPLADYASALRADVKGMVIGVPRDYIDECAPRTAPIVLKRVEEAIGELKSLGARVEEVKIPTLHLATIANAVIYYNEFWAAHKSDAATDIEHRRGAATRADLFGLAHGVCRLYSSAAHSQPLPRRAGRRFSEGELLGSAQPGGPGAADQRRGTDRYVV